MFNFWHCANCGQVFRDFMGICTCGHAADLATIPQVEMLLNEDIKPAWFGGTTNEEGEVYGG